MDMTSRFIITTRYQLICVMGLRLCIFPYNIHISVWQINKLEIQAKVFCFSLFPIKFVRMYHSICTSIVLCGEEDFFLKI